MQCIVIGPVCVFVCLQRAGGRAVSEPYYSQRARRLRHSERFFSFEQWLANITMNLKFRQGHQLMAPIN